VIKQQCQSTERDVENWW